MKVTTNSNLVLSPRTCSTGLSHKPSRWLAVIKNVLSRMQNTMAEPPEPQVKLRRDRSGAEIWQVFDPMTEQTLYFDSEEAVRVWFDRRYYV